MYISKTVYSTWSGLTDRKWPPLYGASDQGFISVVGRLLACGSDTLEKGPNGETARHVASRRGFVDIALIILESSNGSRLLEERDTHGRSVLQVAALYGHTALVQELSKGKIMPNCDDNTRCADYIAPDNCGKTPLHYACAGGNAGVVELLLDKGASINAKDHYGNTPLQVALNWYNAESDWFFQKNTIVLLEALLPFKADPNSKSWSGDTALHAAMYNGHSKKVVNLLEHGAEVNAQGYNLRTPLHIASSMQLNDHWGSVLSDIGTGNAEEVKEVIHVKSQRIEALLLQSGVDTTIKDHDVIHVVPKYVARPGRSA